MAQFSGSIRMCACGLWHFIEHLFLNSKHLGSSTLQIQFRFECGLSFQFQLECGISFISNVE